MAGNKLDNTADIIVPHGGYRKLLSFQLGQLIYDITVRFCELYIDRRSRTNDQMVQAARSGVQNIAEGSAASATSKKTELKLTSVARASLEELRLDYEDYLRQRQLPQWQSDDPVLVRFKKCRCRTMDDVRTWLKEEIKIYKQGTKFDVKVSAGQCQSVFIANAALSLLNLCCHLLDRQIAAQAETFKKEGGFTERLYRVRSQYRQNKGQSEL